MARRSKPTSKGKVHQFGGDWTSAKLAVLEKYLAAYTKALRAQPSPEHPFRKAYIDAFAGTGYRAARRDRGEAAGGSGWLPFPDLAEDAPQRLLDGSARLALQTRPRFDQYIFIEQDADRCRQLEALRAEFPELAGDIRVEQGEANQVIQQLCERDWCAHRAVLFLDPYGLQVEWKTLEAIGKTRAIDLWVLFPLGVGVNRLVTRSGEIPDGWRRRLDLLLGTTDWYDEFYRVESNPSLFDADEERVVKATMETIGRYFNERLEGVFAGVAKQPGVLRNSSNSPLYLLCFAVANPRGKGPALRIAEHLLRDLQ